MNKGQPATREPADEEASDLPKTKHYSSSSQSRHHHTLNLFLYIIAISLVLFIVVISLASSNSQSFSWSSPLLALRSNYKQQEVPVAKSLPSSMSLQKLRQSVTFLPLKDLRFATKASEGHTWFMSTLNDTHEEDSVQYQHFPSNSSKGRLLCVKGRDNHDGAWNYYGLAWPEALPEKATVREGLTFVSYSYYVYGNIWHGLSAMVPFAEWHLRNGCRIPARWVLYYLGELRTELVPWLATLMEAVYGANGMKIEGLEGVDGDAPVCFEEAVVMRHNEGGMSRQRREEVYDLIRCKARAYCNVTVEENKPIVRVTMFMRTEGRSFKNDTHVIGIFKSECDKIQGCHIHVAYPDNLTACQQVRVMSETDVLITPHGAQLTNLFLMEKGSSVMEFYPKGWLKLAGVGQYVYQWMTNWSGMSHKGVWRDPDGPSCEFPEDDHRCMSVYKNAQIGHNETHFKEWARTVFNEFRARRSLDNASKTRESELVGCGCP